MGESYNATLKLDKIPSQVKVGDNITFSGTLTTSDGRYVIPNRVVYIKDDVTALPDTTIRAVITDANGKFTANWTAKLRSSGDYQFYAIFEGDNYVKK